MPPPASAWMRISELSRRTEVTPDLLRVWQRRYGLLEPRRSPGNLRLYSALDEARVRLMKRHLDDRVPAAQAAELARAASFSIASGARGEVPAEEAARSVGLVTRSLLSFDEQAAEQVVQQLLAEYAVTAVIRDVALPCLRAVGELWATGEATVAHEHFASHFAHSRLLALARGWDHSPGPRALLACAPQEQHTLGLIAFGIALHRLGWRITYLGAQTPLDALEHAAEQVQPALVVVSVTIDAGLRRYAQELARIGRLFPLAFGGRGANAELAHACSARLLLGEPVAAARELVSSGRAVAPSADRRPRRRGMPQAARRSTGSTPPPPRKKAPPPIPLS